MGTNDRPTVTTPPLDSTSPRPHAAGWRKLVWPTVELTVRDFFRDNGIEWAISVAPDTRIPVLHEELRQIKGSDFEVVVAPE